MTSRTTIFLASVFLFLVGCDSPVGPDTVEVGDLLVELELSRNSVEVNEEITATVRISNNGNEAETFTGVGCFQRPVVLKTGERQDRFSGYQILCIQQFHSLDIPPGEFVESHYEIRAGSAGAIPTPGTYVFQVEFNMDQPLPTLRAPFRVEW